MSTTFQRAQVLKLNMLAGSYFWQGNIYHLPSLSGSKEKS